MKTHLHKIATYTAFILVSSLPYSADVLAEVMKKPTSVASVSNADKRLAEIQPKVLEEKKRQIVIEARDSITGTRQALDDLEKKDTKAARSTLQDVSKKLADVLAKNPELTMVTAGIAADVFDFEGDAASIKKEINSTLSDDTQARHPRRERGSSAMDSKLKSLHAPRFRHKSVWIRFALTRRASGRIT